MIFRLAADDQSSFTASGRRLQIRAVGFMLMVKTFVSLRLSQRENRHAAMLNALWTEESGIFNSRAMARRPKPSCLELLYLNGSSVDGRWRGCRPALAPKCRCWMEAAATEFVPFDYLASTTQIVLQVHLGPRHRTLYSFTKGDLAIRPEDH